MNDRIILQYDAGPGVWETDLPEERRRVCTLCRKYINGGGYKALSMDLWYHGRCLRGHPPPADWEGPKH